MGSGRRRRAFWFLGGVLLVAVLLRGGGAPVGEGPAGRAVRAPPLPVVFEENRGQLPSGVAYAARVAGGRVVLWRSGEIQLVVGHQTLPLECPGGKRPAPEPRERLPGSVSYLLGEEPARWRTEIPTWGVVTYPDVWPGIDLVLRGVSSRLEYDFRVHPGADPDLIRFRVAGAGRVEVTARGDALVRVPGGELSFLAPRAYQEGSQGPIEVAARYVSTSPEELGFALGPYRRDRALLVDPPLAYASFLGGSGDDRAAAVAVDASGSVYVAGSTPSADFPMAAGARPPGGGSDAFILKLDPSGSRIVYATYLGGALDDFAQAIAVDAAGNAYVAGGTYSSDFPTSGALQPAFGGVEDGFLAKLDATGAALAYATYLGGTGHDRVIAMAVDATGGAYVAGETRSTDFPTQSPYQPANAGDLDVFVGRVNPNGSALVYSTYLGGSLGDFPLGIVVDVAGNAFVAGFTSGPNFPTRNAVQPTYASGGDAFVARLGPTGALLFSTYLGGSATDFAQAIALDPAGEIYVTGFTSSVDFPTVNPAQPALRGGDDAWVLKLGGSGAPIRYATYLGGTGDDQAFGIAVDADGGAHLTGSTRSSNFPTTAGALQPSPGGGLDAFVAELTPNGGNLAYSTYLGGSGDDEGAAIAFFEGVDVVGWTASPGFPTGSAVQPGFAGGANDAWVVRLGAPLDGGVALTPDGGLLSARHLTVGCGCGATPGR